MACKKERIHGRYDNRASVESQDRREADSAHVDCGSACDCLIEDAHRLPPSRRCSGTHCVYMVV